jgi:hypothetical protein
VILPGKENLAAMNHRMTICKTINMPVKNYTLSYQIRIIKVITSLNIITNVIANDYLIRITGEIYVSQNIHIMT